MVSTPEIHHLHLPVTCPSPPKSNHGPNFSPQSLVLPGFVHYINGIIGNVLLCHDAVRVPHSAAFYVVLFYCWVVRLCGYTTLWWSILLLDPVVWVVSCCGIMRSVAINVPVHASWWNMFMGLLGCNCWIIGYAYAVDDATWFSTLVVAIHTSAIMETLVTRLEVSPRGQDEAVCYLVFTAAPFFRWGNWG